MSPTLTQRLIEQLTLLKSVFDRSSARRISSTLKQLRRLSITEPAELILYHETLLFIRAYPETLAIKNAVESELKSFDKRLSSLRELEIDLSALDHPELSGISGTSVSDTFSFDIVCWLLKTHRREIELDWDWFEDENRLADTWPRFMPLLEEDTFVEANIPYRDWLSRARKGKPEIEWLLSHFEKLPLSAKQKAELYNAQQLYVSWKPAFRATRSGLRSEAKDSFYHHGPLIQRRNVDFEHEINQPIPNLTLLNERDGTRALDLAREASTIRYRELYGFTHGDPRLVHKIELDRGLALFVVQLPPDRRLPLRAYHAAMIYKNGVPVGYFEGLSICERMESGFNLYYTFRDGETAWIYAQTMKVMHALTRVTTFSLDPYQVGYENEEGIESGAFWFYRKLGFRSTDAKLRTLTEREEKKITSNKNYRTSASTLRKLARESMIYQPGHEHSTDWDNFQARKIGLRVQTRMAQEFGGDPATLRKKSIAQVEVALGLKRDSLNEVQRSIFSDLALVFSVIPDLNNWTTLEKQQLISIVKAKASRDETRYIREMQKHLKLRQALIKLGS